MTPRAIAVPVLISSLLLTGCWQGAPGDAKAPPRREPFFPALLKTDHRIEPRSTAFDALTASGIAPGGASEIVHAARPVRSLERVAAGTRFAVYRTPHPLSEILKLAFRISETEALVMERESV